MNLNLSINLSGLGRKLAVVFAAIIALVTVGSAIAKMTSNPQESQSIDNSTEISPTISIAPSDIPTQPTNTVIQEDSLEEIVTPTVTPVITATPIITGATLIVTPVVRREREDDDD